MAQFAIQVVEEECVACVDEVWIRDGDHAPYHWCEIHLMRATFLLEESGTTLPRIVSKGIFELPDGK